LAYKHPEKEVQHRTAALVNAVNRALWLHYEKNNTDLKNQISISFHYGKGGKSRTPEQQVYYLLKKTSWTANSSHMADGAKHVLIKIGGAVTWDLDGLHNKQTAAFNVMANALNAAMKSHNLRNHAGGKGFHWKGKDPLHVELPNCRLHDDDPRVIRTLELYAKATRLEGKAKNIAFETENGSAFQKKWLYEYDEKLAAHQKDQKLATQQNQAVAPPPKKW
jgi:hypothetical protein